MSPTRKRGVMSKYLSWHFEGSSGYSQALFSAILGVAPDEPTATVWLFIEATQPVYPGTVMPRSFTVVTPKGKLWTHGNATKHMYETLVSIKHDPLLKGTNPNLFAQFILYDYRKALISLLSKPVPMGKPVRSGHWEFVLSKRKDDKYPVVKHALFMGLD